MQFAERIMNEKSSLSSAEIVEIIHTELRVEKETIGHLPHQLKTSSSQTDFGSLSLTLKAIFPTTPLPWLFWAQRNQA